MTTTDLETDLRDLVAELAELPLDEVETDTSFEDAGIDSLLAMEIAVHVERRFGCASGHRAEDHRQRADTPSWSASAALAVEARGPGTRGALPAGSRSGKACPTRRSPGGG